MLISLKNYEKDNVLYGQYFESDHLFIFFGNKNFEKEHFSLFPSIKFQLLKQVHGNNIVYFDRHTEDVIYADAHFTATKKLALAIQTADCLPIMAYDQHHKWIMGIHAGWRGVENKITKLAIEQFSKVSRTPLLSLFVGPHIQSNSFEVDGDVAEKLRHCTLNENTNFKYDEVKKKYFFDLKKTVHAQAEELHVQIQELYFSNTDTLTDETYSSYRRQKTPCRNWSFIYLK
jgi:YfiH family protein